MILSICVFNIKKSPQRAPNTIYNTEHMIIEYFYIFQWLRLKLVEIHPSLGQKWDNIKYILQMRQAQLNKLTLVKFVFCACALLEQNLGK